MRTIIRSLIFVISALNICLGISATPAFAEKKIGIIIWDDDKNYLEAKEGILAQLDQEGFGASNVTYTIEQVKGNKVKAAEIARKFASANLDMVISIGTSATVAVAKEIKGIPVVFAVVYDPVDSRIAEDWKSWGNNTTGSSSKVPMSILVEQLKRLAPIKQLAVLYTPGEKNSEAQLKDLQAVQTSAGLVIVPVLLTNRAEVAFVVSDVVRRVDAVFLSGSSIVADEVATIVESASKAKVITVSHQSDKVEKGVLLGVTANNRSLGMLAGEKAAKVLKGAKPSSIPIEPLSKLDVIVNMKTARASGISVPPAFLQNATRVLEY